MRCRATFATLFALALWCGLYFAPRLHLPAWAPAPAGLAVTAAGLALLGLPGLRRAGAWLTALGAGLALAAAGLAVLAGGGEPAALPAAMIRGFEGVLVRDSTPAAGGGVRYLLRLRRAWGQGLEASAGGLVEVEAREAPRLHWGRGVRVRGRVLRSRADGRVRFVSRPPAGALQVLGYGSPLLRGRAALRQELERRLQACAPAAAGLLSALLLGDREGVSEADRALFRESGSLHLLALSGLHAGILFAAASFLLSWLPDRRRRAVLGAVLLFAYLFLAGGSPSLARAVLMLAAGATGFLLDRDARPLNLLSLAAAGILLADPQAAADLSFQLSFLALLGILLLGPALHRRLCPPLPRPLASAVAMSLGAQAATTPVLLAAFGAAYPAGALAALPLVPLVTVFLWLGLAALLFSLLPAPALLGGALAVLQRGILATAGLFAHCPPVRAAWRPACWLPAALGLAALLFVRPRSAP